jgi:predicted dehydrogenase
MNKIGRREFLERSLLAAAASVPVLSATPARTRGSQRPAGPSERVRLALVGVGSRGLQQLSAFMHMQDALEVAALCDVDERNIARASKLVEDGTGKKPAYVKDIRSLLDDKSIDAVSIATPNHWHALAALWAMQAGKDAYVEKAISHNVWEGRQLVEAARKYNRVVTQGSNRRSWPSHIQAMEFLHSGKLGRVKRVHGICYKPRGSIGRKPDAPVPQGVDYDLWLGPARVQPFNPNRFYYNWHWQWDYGNGDLGNTGVHDMDVIVWGIGKSACPAKVVSLGGRFGYEDDGETPNTQLVALDYGDLPITYEVRGLKTPSYYDARIGSIFHCTDGYLVVALQGVAAFDSTGQKIKSFGARPADGDDVGHLRNFVDAVKSRNPQGVRVSVLEGHIGSSCCHLPNISYRLGTLKPLSTKEPLGAFAAGNECYERICRHLKDNGVSLEKTPFRMGRELTFDPKTETFVGDAEANALLRRDYRKPFVMPETVS